VQTHNWGVGRLRRAAERQSATDRCGDDPGAAASRAVRTWTARGQRTTARYLWTRTEARQQPTTNSRAAAPQEATTGWLHTSIFCFCVRRWCSTVVRLVRSHDLTRSRHLNSRLYLTPAPPRARTTSRLHLARRAAATPFCAQQPRFLHTQHAGACGTWLLSLCSPFSIRAFLFYTSR
jgi:hypothetical protein